MMTGIDIKLTAKGTNSVQTMGDALAIAKALNCTLHVGFIEGFNVSVQPESSVLDLSIIVDLERKIHKLKQNESNSK